MSKYDPRVNWGQLNGEKWTVSSADQKQCCEFGLTFMHKVFGTQNKIQTDRQIQVNKINYTTIQGGPKRMQHLQSLISKKSGTKSNEWVHYCVLHSFFLLNDTKINDFDEGVLILEPFFWGNVIFNFFFFRIKIHDWGTEEFLWVAHPDCNTAKLRNECVSLFILSSLFKARAYVLPGDAKQ